MLLIKLNKNVFLFFFLINALGMIKLTWIKKSYSNISKYLKEFFTKVTAGGAVFKEN